MQGIVAINPSPGGTTSLKCRPSGTRILKSRTLQQNVARVLDQILADFLRMLERMVAQWVAQHTFMRIFGIGSHKATTAANIGSSAAEGGAAAYASAAAIPVLGWSIAPGVA